jgi:hypothetical protein
MRYIDVIGSASIASVLYIAHKYSKTAFLLSSTYGLLYSLQVMPFSTFCPETGKKHSSMAIMQGKCCPECGERNGSVQKAGASRTITSPIETITIEEEPAVAKKSVYATVSSQSQIGKKVDELAPTSFAASRAHAKIAARLS